METIRTYIKISRYRFWAYTAGPFVLGTILGVSKLDELFSLKFLIILVFFLIPFNFFIYSVNDYFDKDTDQYNPKKDIKESRYSTNLKSIFKWGLFIFFIFLLIIFSLLGNSGRLLLTAVTVISFFYSAPPLRFKARPFIDSFSNILYAIPGFIGFGLFSTEAIPLSIIYIAFAYTSAMHLFSAVPDIDSDSKARLKTSAVILGRNLSLIVCLLLWFSISILLLNTNILVFTLSLIYPLMALFALIKFTRLERLYWFFPYINTIVGFLIFWIIVITKF